MTQTILCMPVTLLPMLPRGGLAGVSYQKAYFFSTFTLNYLTTSPKVPKHFPRNVLSYQSHLLYLGFQWCRAYFY